MYNLLIVEDEEIIRNGLRNSIDWESMGYKVVGVASDGFEGLKLFKVLQPQVLLTDIKMPEFDGIALLKEIKKLDPGAEVVLLSGYAEFEYARQAVAHDAFSYILKMDLFSQLEPVFRQLKEHLDAARKKDMEVRKLKTDSDNQAFISAIREKEWDALHIGGNSFCTAVVGAGWNLCRHADAGKLEECSVIQGEYAGRGIFLYYGNSEEGVLKGIQNALKKIAADSQRPSTVIGVGSMVHKEKDITASYYEAMKMVDLGTYEKKGGFSVYEYNRIGLDSRGVNGRWSAEFFIQLLLSGKDTEFLKNIGEYIKDSIFSRDITVPSIRSYILGIFGRLSIICDFPPMKDQYSELAAGICRLDSMLEIFHWIEGILPGITKTVKSYRAANDGSMQAAIAFIDKNYGMEIKMEDVARYFFISPPYFSAQFKKFTGMTFTGYMKLRRLEWASHLILSTNKKISVIAGEVGYEDEKHFSRLFKEKYGMTPAQYRYKSP